MICVKNTRVLRANEAEHFLRFVLAMMCTLMAVLLCSARAESFPSRLVHDRTWGVSARWLQFTVPGIGAQEVPLDLSLEVGAPSCDDPLGRGGRNARPLCQGQLGFVDLWIHVISQSTGSEIGDPLRFGASNTVQLRLVSGQYAVMIHGGPGARGGVTPRVQVRLRSTPPRPLLNEVVAVSDNVMLDVQQAPDEFDVHSVLVGDGPTAWDEVTGAVSNAGRGNDANDWQGVDACLSCLLI